MLAHQKVGLPLAIFTDASDCASGAVIQQKTANGWQPLSFFSRKLDNAQKKYSAYDRELLAVYAAIKHFRHLLEGREFAIFTDHKPLTYAVHQKADNASARQMLHLDWAILDGHQAHKRR